MENERVASNYHENIYDRAYEQILNLLGNNGSGMDYSKGFSRVDFVSHFSSITALIV